MDLKCGVNGKNDPLDTLALLDKTPFFEAMCVEAKYRLLSAMEAVKVSAGERFISQGEEGNSFYIIKSGSCCVTIEKEGVLHPVAVLDAGDLVGEMALLTGENRSAHVTSQSDMELLKMTRSDFELVCGEYPEIRQFLTQTVALRFARASVTADRVVGKYIITEIIGRGGWSIVYKGAHTSLNMPVAIKMLRHNMAMEKSFLDEFQNEARTIAGLNHENIVKVYDIEHLYRTVFIVMEYLEGASLEAVLREQGIQPISKTLQALLQVCSGLGFAHDHGVIHRDIKPGNIFLQKSGVAKIVDFGLACPVGARGERLVGTPRYLSPEQIKGLPVDARSDIYSLGVAAYRLLTGRDAFTAMDIPSLLQMQLYDEVPDPRGVNPEIPVELSDFVRKATRKAPEDRYQNVAQILQELKPLAGRLGVDLPPESSKAGNLMTLFLFYRDEHQQILNRLISEFTQELAKTGVILRNADLKNI
jgi:serine/threonine protein kinase